MLPRSPGARPPRPWPVLDLSPDLQQGADLGTVAVYDRTAPAYVSQTLNLDMGVLHHDLASRFAPGSRLLDVGFGSGRDALALDRKGFFVDALDPSSALVEDFTRREPDFAGKVFQGTVAGLATTLPAGGYDGAYAVASLLHVPEDQWPETLHGLHRAVRTGGLLYVSVKQQPSGADGNGRWFTGFASLEALRHTLESTGQWAWVEGDHKSDVMGRGTVWLEGWCQAR